MFASSLLSATAVGAAEPAPTAAPPSPLSAEQSLEYFHLPEGLKVEVVAAEPQVVDPVAIQFDERGRMWVVEMRDYPHGPAEGEQAQSKIKVLEDRDGDGRFETATVFAENLLFVTGVQPWQEGVFVTMAGRVAYMKDTDGDGRADQTQTWFTGFAQENSQLRANHPRLGLDNHIYIANGLRGGTVQDARNPEREPVSISGMDFRFDPLSDSFEAVSGVGQFGLTFDDSGNRFVCSNRNPLVHIVLEDRYLKRNPKAAIPSAVHDVARAGADSRLYPLSRAWTTSTLHANQFTAACGVTIFRGDALPADYYGNGFTCDPTGNLVHREVLQAAGATFQSQPARDGVEFLASPDEWFRPVNMEVGPEGALYVVDMYRAVIEHPQFMPEELKTRPDLRHGDDRGRIYRIVAAGNKRPQPATFDKSNVEQLVAALESPGQWPRETAARLLLERQEKGAEPQLREMARQGKRPTARLSALWLLAGLDALQTDDVRHALNDADALVRRQAVALSERWLNDSVELREQVEQLACDTDPAVRFQVALSLAPIQQPEQVETLRQIALQSVADPWTRRAVAVATGDFAADLFLAVLPELQLQGDDVDARLALVDELARLAGSSATADQQADILAALAQLGQDEGGRRVRLVAINGLAEALARRRTPISQLVDKLDDSELKQQIQQTFADAAAAAADPQRPLSARIAALELLAHAPKQTETLERLALREPNQSVRLRAISSLARQSVLKPWKTLLDAFPSESPTVRRAILDGVLSRGDRTTLLLDRIESGIIKPGELEQTHTSRLTRYGNEDIRDRAVKLLADAIPEDRKQVLQRYQSALTMNADPERGREIFRKNCSTCHRIDNIGVDVAPDISDSRTKTPDQLLTDILQPNRAIDNNYISYSVLTQDGRLLTGILTSESASSISLKQPEGKELTLLRSDIDELRSNGVSLMPEGLEKTIPLQDMADLVSFIKNWRYLDGRVPLGQSK